MNSTYVFETLDSAIEKKTFFFLLWKKNYTHLIEDYESLCTLTWRRFQLCLIICASICLRMVTRCTISISKNWCTTRTCIIIIQMVVDDHREFKTTWRFWNDLIFINNRCFRLHCLWARCYWRTSLWGFR